MKHNVVIFTAYVVDYKCVQNNLLFHFQCQVNALSFVAKKKKVVFSAFVG